MKKVILLIVCLIPGLAFNTDPVTLELDIPQTGILEQPGEEDIYLYEGHAGESITIQVTPGTHQTNSGRETALFSAAVKLYREDGSPLAINYAFRNNTGDFDTALLSVRLPADETYRLGVLESSRTLTGTYEITIRRAQSEPHGGFLDIGDSISGELNEGTTASYFFTPPDNMIVLVQLGDETGDAIFVNIYDPKGYGFGELIPDFRESREVFAAGDEVYEIQLMIPDGIPPQSYAFTVQTVDFASIQSFNLDYGTAVLVTDNDRYFSFEGSAGDAVSLTVTTEIQMRVMLYDPGNTLISCFPVFPESGKVYILSEDGRYNLFTSTTVNGVQLQGDYTVTLSPAAAPEQPDISLEIGQTVNGDLDCSEEDVYTFSGTAGDVISVQVDSVYDTILDLYTGSRSLLLTDDDSGSDRNAAINSFTLPETGTYHLVIRGFGAHAVDNYGLTLRVEN